MPNWLKPVDDLLQRFSRWFPCVVFCVFLSVSPFYILKPECSQQLSVSVSEYPSRKGFAYGLCCKRLTAQRVVASDMSRISSNRTCQKEDRRVEND